MTPDGFHYATRQAIRKESGRQHRVSAERPSGVLDGSNKDFYVAKKYIVDRNNDDLLTIADVVAYVDGAAVTTTAVDGNTGKIALTVAPSSAQIVTVDYQFSELADTDIDEVRDEAESWLTGRVKGYLTVADFVGSAPGADPFVASNYPKVFSTIIKLYAAALILIRDYGSGADTDLTSKDGYKKLSLAKSLLSDWISEINEDGTNVKEGRPTMRTDGHIFRRNSRLDDTSPSPDDRFMRKE